MTCRRLLLLALLSLALDRPWGRAAAAAPPVGVAAAPQAVGTDLDGVPPGLSADDELAWLEAHAPLPAIVVTPADRP